VPAHAGADAALQADGLTVDKVRAEPERRLVQDGPDGPVHQMQLGVAEAGSGDLQEDLARTRDGLGHSQTSAGRCDPHGRMARRTSGLRRRRPDGVGEFMPPCATWPPSTGISAPLIQLDSSEIRKTTTGATSSAVPGRPSGIPSTACA